MSPENPGFSAYIYVLYFLIDIHYSLDLKCHRFCNISIYYGLSKVLEQPIG